MNSDNWTRFYKVSPGGNTTILLDSAKVAPELRVEVANRLMSNLSLCGEQVGFIEWPYKEVKDFTPALNMMGGEFCANALRSYAAVLALEQKHALPWRGQILSSGAGKPINAYVAARNGYVDAAIEVPLGVACHIRPLCSGSGSPGKEEGVQQGAVVDLPGITHVVLPGNPDYENVSLEMDRDLIRSAENWRNTLGLAENAAVGCVWYYFKKDQLSMQPLVWVRDTNTSCLETSCGSGAIALALYLGEVRGQKTCGSAHDATSGGVHSAPYVSYTNFYCIMQPSGQPLWVSYSKAARSCLESVWLGGACEIIARGETRT